MPVMRLTNRARLNSDGLRTAPKWCSSNQSARIFLTCASIMRFGICTGKSGLLDVACAFVVTTKPRIFIARTASSSSSTDSLVLLVLPHDRLASSARYSPSSIINWVLATWMSRINRCFF